MPWDTKHTGSTKSISNEKLTRRERELSEERGGLDICSESLMMSDLRGDSPVGGALWGERRFVKYFLIHFSFFYLTNKVVYYGVGPWVLFYLVRILFYLVRQSCEPSTGDSRNFETKNKREGWCGSSRAWLMSQKMTHHCFCSKWRVKPFYCAYLK